MGYENAVIQMLEETLPQSVARECYFYNGVLNIPESLDADRVFFLLETSGKFYSYPTILQEVV